MPLEHLKLSGFKSGSFTVYFRAEAYGDLVRFTRQDEFG